MRTTRSTAASKLAVLSALALLAPGAARAVGDGECGAKVMAWRDEQIAKLPLSAADKRPVITSCETTSAAHKACLSRLKKFLEYQFGNPMGLQDAQGAGYFSRREKVTYPAELADQALLDALGRATMKKKDTLDAVKAQVERINGAKYDWKMIPFAGFVDAVDANNTYGRVMLWSDARGVMVNFTIEALSKPTARENVSVVSIEGDRTYYEDYRRSNRAHNGAGNNIKCAQCHASGPLAIYARAEFKGLVQKDGDFKEKARTYEGINNDDYYKANRTAFLSAVKGKYKAMLPAHGAESEVFGPVTLGTASRDLPWVKACSGKGDEDATKIKDAMNCAKCHGASGASGRGALYLGTFSREVVDNYVNVHKSMPPAWAGYGSTPSKNDGLREALKDCLIADYKERLHNWMKEPACP
jgi:hypothetical protein